MFLVHMKTVKNGSQPGLKYDVVLTNYWNAVTI